MPYKQLLWYTTRFLMFNNANEQGSENLPDALSTPQLTPRPYLTRYLALVTLRFVNA